MPLLPLLLVAAASGDGSLKPAMHSTPDAWAMIQYNVQVASGEKTGSALEDDSSALEQHEAQGGDAALTAAQEAAARARVEFEKLDAAVHALTVRSACAEQATFVQPRLAELTEKAAELRRQVEAVLEGSSECAVSEDKDMALLEFKHNSRRNADDAWAGAFNDFGTFDLSTVPGTFGQWHTGHFMEGFKGNWQAISTMGQQNQEVSAVDLHMRRDCPEQAKDDGKASHAGVHLMDSSEANFQFPGIADPMGGSSGADDSFGPHVTSSMGTMGRNHTDSKWDEIMKNGFKQMSNMMKPKDNSKHAPWYLLIVFLVLALLILVALMVVSRPMMSVGQEEAKEDDGRSRRAFIQIALVYWLPVTPKSTGITFCTIFASILVSCLCANFWVAAFFIMLVKQTDSKLGPKVSKVAVIDNEVLKALAGIGVFITPIIFFLFRKDLQGRWRQWCFLVVKVFFLFEGHLLSIFGSYMARCTMNYMASMDADAFWHLVRTWQLAMIAIGVLDSFISGYVDQVLTLEWRRFIAEYILSSYMGGQSFYKMNSNSGKDDGADNPDQRMQGDTEVFVSALNTFVFSIIKTVITLISSTIIVWTIIPRITMILLAYCCIGSFISLLFTWKFVKIQYNIAKLEADYRYSMVHIRDNAEGIAMYGGENEGQGEVNERFSELVRWKYYMIQWNISFGCYQFFYTSIGDIGPMILLAQMLLRGNIDFGAVGQVGSHFTQVMSSMSFINTHVQLMSSLGTSTNRLTGMLSKMEQLQGGEEIVYVTTTDNKVEVRDLCVKTPDDRLLVQNLNISFNSRGASRLLVVGRSGVGKSSLMRTLAGLWSQGSGEIHMPPKGDCMFLPQKPYMPLGSLRKQLCYPAVGHAANDADLRSMLEELGLGDLPDRFEDGFDSVRDWGRVLSLGEQQRVAAIRAMIHQPMMVVLDESTSALSIVDENLVYKRFSDLGMSYISVGHRMTIVKFHDQILELFQEHGSYKLHNRAEYQQVLEKQPSTPC